MLTSNDDEKSFMTSICEELLHNIDLSHELAYRGWDLEIFGDALVPRECGGDSVSDEVFLGTILELSSQYQARHTLASPSS